MRHLPLVFLLLGVAACATDEPAPATASPLVDDLGEPVGELPDITLGADSLPDSASDPGDPGQPPPPLSFCDLACTAISAEATADCAEFAVGAAACGIASASLCEAVCHSRGPRSHCSTVYGGRGCVSMQYMWWCDTAVDGNRVRIQYELDPPYSPGVVKTVWAPSHACNTVGFPTAAIVKQWRVCAENHGCSAWFHP